MLIILAYSLLWLALIVYIVAARSGRAGLGRAAAGAAVAGWLALTAGLVQRAGLAGHWPLANRYEFGLCLAWAIVGLYLLLEISWRERRAGAFVLAIALLAATYALTRPPDEQALAPLLPALRSTWLQVHVFSILLGFGAGGLAAGLGLVRLLRPAAAAAGEPAGRLDRLLPAEATEQAIGRVVALGFPWLTLGILSGAIWAQQAWGRYWGWDPKESWALVTWLWYLLILHLLPLRRWRGRRLAGLAVTGFGIVLFTFAGVPWLVGLVRLESLHGF